MKLVLDFCDLDFLLVFDTNRRALRPELTLQLILLLLQLKTSS